MERDSGGGGLLVGEDVTITLDAQFVKAETPSRRRNTGPAPPAYTISLAALSGLGQEPWVRSVRTGN